MGEIELFCKEKEAVQMLLGGPGGGDGGTSVYAKH